MNNKYKLKWTFGKLPISQKFGENPKWYVPYGLDGHEGIDIAMPVGTNIKSISNGKVVIAIYQTQDFYGRYVCVWDDTQDIAIFYCHLQDVYVNLDTKVKTNQVIGLSGQTGRCFGPHLHMMICETQDGYRKNYSNGYQGMINPFGNNIAWISKGGMKL